MVKSLIHGALEQRVVIVVVALVLLGFGLRAPSQLSMDAFPDVTNIQVQVATEALGRSPEEMERFITVPVEIAMTGLPGLTEMRSLNKSGLSIITLVFTDETDVYFARQLVMERLIGVQDRLPPGVTPVLGPVSTGLGEVYQYTLQRPDDGGRALTPAELIERRTIQDWVVRPLLRSIPGVAEINSQGGYVKQYHVLVDPDRLHHYQISLKEIEEALIRNNANSGGGVLPHYAEQYLIRGLGLIASIEDIGNIILKEFGGTPIYIRDVASIRIGHEVRQGAIIKNGVSEQVSGIVLMIRGGNAMEVVGRVKEKVAEINEQGLLPGGLEIVPYYDRTDLVGAALNTVTKTLLEGVVLVIVILFVFLGDIRSSFIVVCTLVLTPLLTFMVMNRYGISANLMSLGGLAIAIGLIVDGSVVVVENTFRYLSERRNTGESKTRIVLEAAVEVGKPVIFGVGIIIVVFLPLFTLEGMEGKIFSPLALTISIALSISLLLSLVLSPVLCSYVLKGGSEEDTRLIAWLKRGYLKLLAWALNWRITVVLSSVLLLGLALSLFPYLGKSFIPVMKEGALTPQINRVAGMSLSEAIRMEMYATSLIREVPGVEMVVSKLGRGESPADPVGPNESDPIVTLKPRAEWPEGWTQDDIDAAIRDKLKALPGVQIVLSQPIAERVDEMVSGVKSQLAIKLFGDDLSALKRTADDIARLLRTVEGTRDLRVERVSGQQYLLVDVNRHAIARHGINVADVHSVIETAIRGKVATHIYEGERRFAALVRFPESNRNSPEAISRILLTSASGARVPIEDLADVRLEEGPARISRESAKRRIVVGANLVDRDMGGYVDEVQQKIAEQIKLPEGYFLVWGGQFENMERAMARLTIIVPLTIAIIFFLLFVLFNTVRLAALIILVLPFASIGGIVALFLTGEYLSVPASVGFIALWGIAVLNGVVLVSYIRSLRDGGLEQWEAIVQGCAQRFRPVLMTATVAMLGLTPMLFAEGPGSEVQRPLAVVVIGGLISSTALTLIVVPVLYRWFDVRRRGEGGQVEFEGKRDS
ncbi:efflux RND transporter permease subunit [Nitrosococcus oceani]|uniref:efflux RND transporter permease subunit n=1 Tax=Nitrosococcus oceani TaxID=1229 RepID=UPI0004E8D30B|nr:CusA/CzcA family heavy metal efflux RND transporter [Nitrosococcus oceani]KFI24014.1 cytochrome C peroxidase [Nitrosococcus oceani]